MRLIGIVLIVLGVIVLAIGGISYTSRHTVLDAGPLQAQTEQRKTIPISPIAGIAAVAGGIALVAVGSRRRV